MIDKVTVLRLNNIHLEIYFPNGLLEFTSDSKIEELDLCKSRLSVLPPSIGKLQCLRKLYLDYNELTTLPFSISHCTKLDYLSLTFNKICYFPGILLSMSSLKDMRRHSNPTDYSISLLASARLSGYIRQVNINDGQSKHKDEVPSLKNLAIQKGLSANITQPYWRNKKIPYMLIRQLDDAQHCHQICEYCHCSVHKDSHNGIYLQWLCEEFLGLKTLPFQSFACMQACAEALVADIVPCQQHIMQGTNTRDKHLVHLNISRPTKLSSRTPSCVLQ